MIWRLWWMTGLRLWMFCSERDLPSRKNGFSKLEKREFKRGTNYSFIRQGVRLSPKSGTRNAGLQKSRVYPPLKRQESFWKTAFRWNKLRKKEILRFRLLFITQSSCFKKECVWSLTILPRKNAFFLF